MAWRGDPDLSDRMAFSSHAGPRRLGRSPFDSQRPRAAAGDAGAADPNDGVPNTGDPTLGDTRAGGPDADRREGPGAAASMHTGQGHDGTSHDGPSHDGPSPDGPGRRAAAATPDQIIDVRLIGRRLHRLSRLDPGVFRDVRDDPTQTLAATLVVLGAVLLSALGGWLWLIAEAEGLSTGRILVRQVVLGTIFGLAVWALWVIGAQVMLQSVFERRAPGTRLLRTMGYAAFPVAGSVLMVVPALGFAVGLLTVIAWFAASNAAVEAAVPEATRKEALVANLAGFSLFVIVMSVLADAAGVAPGFFVRAADLSAYA